MVFYCILPFLLLYIAPNIKTKVAIGKHGNSKTNNLKALFWILLVFSLSFIWLYGLRDMGGVDDAAYRLYYERNYGGSIFDFLSTDKEPLFNLLKTMGYALGLNYKCLFLGYAIIDICFLIGGLKNYYQTKADLTLYLASFYFIAFSGVFTTMRQSTVMAMLFYFYSLEHPSWKKRAIMWILMICSHYGFLILLPVEIIFSARQYRLNKGIKIILPCICLVLGTFVDLGGIIQKVTGILGLYSYMNDSGNYTNVSGVGIVTLVLFGIYLYLLIKEKRVPKDTPRKAEIFQKITYGNMMYFSILFLTARLRWGNRLGYYYLFTVPMLICYLYEILPVKRKGKLLKYSFITLLYVGFLIVMKGVLGENGYVWSMNFWG